MPRAFRKVLIGSFHLARQADNGEREDPMCKRVHLSTSAISAPLQWPSAMVLEYL